MGVGEINMLRTAIGLLLSIFLIGCTSAPSSEESQFIEIATQNDYPKAEAWLQHNFASLSTNKKYKKEIEPNILFVLTRESSPSMLNLFLQYTIPPIETDIVNNYPYALFSETSADQIQLIFKKGLSPDQALTLIIGRQLMYLNDHVSQNALSSIKNDQIENLWKQLSQHKNKIAQYIKYAYMDLRNESVDIKIIRLNTNMKYRLISHFDSDSSLGWKTKYVFAFDTHFQLIDRGVCRAANGSLAFYKRNRSLGVFTPSTGTFTPVKWLNNPLDKSPLHEEINIVATDVDLLDQ